MFAKKTKARETPRWKTIMSGVLRENYEAIYVAGITQTQTYNVIKRGKNTNYNNLSYN